MLSKALTTVGKVLLIGIGGGFGLVRSLRSRGAATIEKAQLELFKARIDALDLAMARLGEQGEEFQSRLDRSITREELSRTLDGAFGKIESDVDARFDRQARSVEALRLMIGQTDELLQKVLDRLESIRSDEDLAESWP